jgi:hypothetical protein
VSGCERKPDRAQPSKDGTTHIVLGPVEMLQKLAALVPAPHAHLVRYAGLFAPAAKWRSAIVPAATSSTEAESTVVSRGVEISICLNDSSAHFIEAAITDGQPCSSVAHARNYTWAELMKRVWALDVLECPRCRALMRVLADIHSPDAVEKILKCLDLPSRAPPASSAAPKFPLPSRPF